MNDNPETGKNAAKEFLLKEYEYFTESFHKNEEVGEKRIDFFTAFVTAVIGGLVALINSDNGISGQPLKLTVIAGLFSLLLIGWLTLLRLLKRNKATDEFKDNLDNLRRLFRIHYGSENALSKYDPFHEEKQTQNTRQDPAQEKGKDEPEKKFTPKDLGYIKFIACKWARHCLLAKYGKELPEIKIEEFLGTTKTRNLGGLVDFVAVIIALLFAGLVAAIVYPVPECIESARSKIDNIDIAIVTGSALSTFAIAFVLQRIYIIYYHLISAFEIKKPWKHMNSD